MASRMRIIGPSPVFNVLKFALLCCVAEGLLVLGMKWSGPGSTFGGICGILVIISPLVWLFLGPMILGMFIAAFFNQVGGYRRARKAIREGFNANYVVRGGLCNGIIMVDETNKKLFVNGLIVPFTTVESVYSSGSLIEVKLRKGVDPIHREKSVKLDMESAAKVFGYRLQDSLGFSK